MCVGDRLEVYWPDPGRYYAGTVMNIKRSEGRVQLHYDDDNARLTHILADEAWRVCVPSGPDPPPGVAEPDTTTGDARPFVFEEGCAYGVCRCDMTCASVAGCPSALRLPARLRAVYDTTGWRCCGVRDNGAQVVFMRPPGGCPLRGSGATQKRMQFGWSPEQVLYTHTRTHTHTRILSKDTHSLSHPPTRTLAR